MTIFLTIPLAALLCFLCVIFLRTIRFRPKAETPVQTAPIPLNEEKIVRDMADMIRCKTVSYQDEDLVDPAEFEKFYNSKKMKV